MKRITFCFLLVILFGILAACCISEETNKYDGRTLNIGVVGPPPEIQEEKVIFTPLQSSDLKEKTLYSKFDAIFIVGENMPKDTPAKYTDLAKDSKVPFFFSNMESSGEDKTYAMGYMYNDNKFESWTYSLPDNVENESNINGIYIRIFEDISKNTIQKK